PLTTPCASRPFAGRPPRGSVPPAGPGILVPDVPVAAPGYTRFRELAREGFLVLAAPGARDVTAPVPVVPLASIDVTGALTEALAARPGELWLVRPDAYVAAVVTEPAELDAAIARALGGQPSATSSLATRAVRTGT
ncbi:MAG TPA: pentachlorophenol monooxygenase, partial [Amycolatopsis sp.]|nr:pentachlorophenol monooxygenase [Amycolatopsis sp.]